MGSHVSRNASDCFVTSYDLTEFKRPQAVGVGDDGHEKYQDAARDLNAMRHVTKKLGVEQVTAPRHRCTISIIAPYSLNTVLNCFCSKRMTHIFVFEVRIPMLLTDSNTS